MNDQLLPNDLRRLPVSDRLRLIEELWDSLDSETDSLPMPDWHRRVLDERIAAHDRDPGAARPWAEVKADILGAIKK